MTFLSKFDIFKQPVQLKLHTDNKISTHFGKLVTFFMVFYTIYTLMQSNLILRKNPTVKVENFRPLLRPHLYFNSSNFTFAVGLYDLDLGYVADPTMFSYSAGLLLWDNSNNDFVDTKLAMEICTEADFVNAGDNFKGTFQNNLFCFRLKNETIHLFGSYNERMIKFLYLDLQRCKNSSENNFTCKDIEQQENFLQDKGFFFEEREKEDSYVVESVIYDFQSNNFEKENKPLARLEVYSDSQETVHSRKYQHIQDLLAEMEGVLNIFFLVGMLAINLEIPFIMTKRISSELYSYQIAEKMVGKCKKQEEGDENKESTNLESRKKIEYSHITKTFTLTDISPIDLKSIGKKLKTAKPDLVNETMELSRKDFSKSSSLKNKIKDAKSKAQENNIFSTTNRANLQFSIKIPKMPGDEEMICESVECINDNVQIQRKSLFSASASKIDQSIEKENFRKKVSFMQTAVKFSIDLKNKLNFSRLLESQFKRGNKNFPISFLSYLSILLKCKRFKLNQKEKLFLLGEKQIRKDLDIFKIINSMNDVEKLKMILLNDKQRYLFNLLKKPIITTKKINKEEETNPLIVNGTKNKVNRSLVESFYRELLNNREKSEIDKRILLLLDKNLLNANQKSLSEDE